MFCAKRCTAGIVLLLLVLTENRVSGQSTGTPSFYYSSASGSELFVPLNDANNKTQWIYPPNAFHSGGSTGTAAASGTIETVYIKLSTVYVSTASYTDFTVKLAQNKDTLSSWDTAVWNSGMTTVYYQSSYSIIQSANHQWIKLTLQSPFNYNPDLSLVCELSVSSGTGTAVRTIPGTTNQRLWGTHTSSSPVGKGTGIMNFGVDIIPRVPNNAGVFRLASPQNFCTGVQDLKVDVVNNGTLRLDSVRINWSVDGVVKTPVYYTAGIDTQGHTNGNIKTITVGSDSFPFGVKKSIKIWTSHPNGVADTMNSNDTILVTLMAGLNGNYTIGGTGANYAKIGDAAADLSDHGVCGPVYFFISPGTYTERVVLDKVEGTSVVNKVVFDGGSAANTTVEHDAASTNDWQTILIHNSNFITFKNLTVKVIDATYGVGIHLVGSSNTLLDSCTILMDTTSASFQLIGVAGTGSPTSILSGHSGDSNLISHLTITGGYYGIYYTGTASWHHNTGNRFLFNSITSFYRTGCHLLALSNTVIEGNSVLSQRDPNLKGIVMHALNNFICTKNRVYTKYRGIEIDFGNYYSYKGGPRSILANNMVTNTGSFDAGLFYRYSRHVNIYHNSISVTSFSCVYIEDCDSTDIVNNLFSNTGSKGNVFVLTANVHPIANAVYHIDHNLYYCTTTNPPVYHIPNLYSSISSWFSSVTAMNQHSLNQHPMFISSTDLHLTGGYRPRGTYIGVADDFDGRARCLANPTLGASEQIRGTLADTSIQTNVCVFDTLSYTILPPNGLNKSDYGVKWTIDPVSFKTGNGSMSQNYSIVAPTSSANARLLFHPQPTDGDSAYFLHVVIKDLGSAVCDSVFGKYIRVHSRPIASFSVDTHQTCLGNALYFSNHSTGPANTLHRWDMGDTKVFYDTSFAYTYKNGGVYVVKLKAITPRCSTLFVDTVYVGTVSGAEIITGMPFNGKVLDGSAANPDKACPGDTLSYELLPPAGLTNADHQVTWKITEVSMSTTGGQPVHDTATVLPGATGNFKIRILPGTLFNGDSLLLKVKIISLVASCDTVVTRFMEVGHRSQPDFSASGFCEGRPTHFTDSSSSSGTIASYRWKFGDGYSDSVNNPQHSYASGGNYSISLLTETSTGCKDSITKSISIFNVPRAAFTADTVCHGSTSQFSNTSQADSAVSFEWNFGDASTSTQKDPTHVYAAAGSYQAQLVVMNQQGNCRDSSTGYVIVHAVPQISFTINDISGRQKRFLPSDSNQLSFYWDFGDGNTSNAVSPTHTYPASQADYVVNLEVTNMEGCRDDHTETAHVSITGILIEENEPDLRIYPNPFSGSVFVVIRLEETGNIKLILTDVQGREVYVSDKGLTDAGSYTYEIDATKQGLAPGIYYLQAWMNGGMFRETVVLR